MNRIYRCRPLRLALASTALLLLVSCSVKTVSIADIHRNPRKYENESVRIKGTVVKVYDIPIIRDDLYELADGTGKIWVRTHSSVPRVKERVEIEGRVQSQVQVLSQTYGLLFEED